MTKFKTFNLFVLTIFLFLSLQLVSAEEFYRADIHSPTVPDAPKVKAFGSYSTQLFTGSAVYEFPLEVPPGTNGLQPELRLIYNHDLTKVRPSIFGTAWYLNTAYIQRNIEYTTSDTSDDTFELIFNGEKHELVYIPENQRYHTKIETFTFINKTPGGENENGEYWIVKTKDGTTYRFGYNADSELTLDGGNLVTRWSLDLVTDTHGNNIYYEYQEDPYPSGFGVRYINGIPNLYRYPGDVGTSYLHEITYNNDQTRKIEFILEEELRPDIWMVYEQGHKISESRRIKEIVISVNNELVRKYVLNYDFVQDAKKTFLMNITTFGSDGHSTLPPVSFEYGFKTTEIRNNQEYTYTTGWSLSRAGLPASFLDGDHDLGIRLVDVNNDGWVDVVKGSGSISKVWIKRSDSTWSFPTNIVDADRDYGDLGVRFAELNGDGLIDVLKGNAYSGSSASWINTGSGWARDDRWVPPAFVDYDSEFHRYYSKGVVVADVNGDGLDDLVKGYGEEKKTWINTGSGWSATTRQWTLPASIADNEYARARDIDVRYYGVDQGVRLADMNGDGLVDVIRATPDSCKVWVNTGGGWTSTNWGFPAAFIDIDVISKELNGREYDFIIYGVDQGVRLADVNGDGLVDVIKANSDDSHVWLTGGSGGQYWRISTPFTDPYGKDLGTRLADLNGDGLVDVVREANGHDTLLTNRLSKPFLLYKVIDNLGGETIIDYQKSTSLDNTREDDLNDLGFNKWVVNTTVKNNSMEVPNIIVSLSAYDYSGGFYDYEDKEFRGFANVTETKADGTLIKHSFHQDDAKKGREYQTEIYDEDALLKKKETTWDAAEGDGYYIVSLTEDLSYDYDPASTDYKTTKTTYSYDDYGNVLAINHLGDTDTEEDDKHEVFEYVYNTATWVVDKLKHHVILESDEETVFSESWYYYDSHTLNAAPTKGDLTKEKHWLSTGDDIGVTYTYDDYGNLLTETDPNGQTTTYAYDDTNTFPITITNALDQATTFEYDLGTGNFLSETDPNDYTTSYEYDVFGRKIKEILPGDSSSSPTISWEYTFDGTAPEKIKVVFRIDTSNIYSEQYYYDGLGNLVQSKKDADNNKQIINNYYYNELNQLSSVSNNYLAASSASYSTPSSTVAKVSYEYDNLERVTKIINPDDTKRNIEYGLWEETVTDENGNSKKYSSDAYGRTIAVEEHNGGETYPTQYDYDLSNNIIKITDALGNNFSYTYDSLGRLIAMIDPDLGEWVYSYDAAGNLVNQTNANDDEITMSYDELNRVTEKTQGNSTITYTYDEEIIGTLSTIATPAIKISYEYDERLRPITETKVIDEDTFVIEKEYDGLDRVTKKIVDGEEIVYTYGKQGLTNLNDLVSFTYNPFNLPLERVYDSELKTKLTYNSETQRMESITTDDKQVLIYDYDAVGNVVGIADSIHNSTTAMSYDNLDRLTSAERNGGEVEFSASYTYDSVGNMLTAEVDDEAYEFSYGESPVHSPLVVNGPPPICGEDENLVGNKCELKPGCAYNNPACEDNLICAENKCVQCTDDNTSKCLDSEKPVCAENICVECLNDNNCNAEEECVNNVCVLRSGCQYNNPACSSNQDCVNNVCVLKSGCAYNNPSCDSNHNCVNNVCVLRSGCQYNNPACEIGYECVDNICVKSCTDSDGGREPYISGTTEGYSLQGNFQTYTDECVLGTSRVYEFTCGNNGRVQTHVIDCPFGCADGACLPDPCLECDNDEICVDGECIEVECTDSDGGRDPFVRGTTVGLEGSRLVEYTDTCVNQNRRVLEYSCWYNDQIRSSWITCLSGCADGACLSGPSPDLTITKFNLINPNQVQRGEEAVYELIIENIGGVSAENIAWEIKIMENNRILAESGTFPIDRLNVGNKMAIYPRFSYPCKPIVAKVDPNNLIVEAEEENNFFNDNPTQNICDLGTTSDPLLVEENIFTRINFSQQLLWSIIKGKNSTKEEVTQKKENKNILPIEKLEKNEINGPKKEVKVESKRSLPTKKIEKNKINKLITKVEEKLKSK